MRAANRIAWAIAIACVAGLIASAARVERWLAAGQPPRLVFEVRLPDDDPRADDRVVPALRARLRDRHPAFEGRPGDRRVIVHVDGAPREDALVRELLTRTGRLEFFEVVDGSDTARRWFQQSRAGELGPDVEGVPDTWSNERTREPIVDYFLKASSAEALDAAIARAEPLPAGLRVAYERLERPGDGEVRPYVRTYLLRDEPELDGRDIQKASVIHDRNTMRPEVLVHFGRRGAARFGELTHRLIGHKLAIMLDGWVSSAPIVQTAITRGICTITMGGTDPAAMEAEAQALVNVLRSGAGLPAGLEATLLATQPGSAGSTWLPRLALALLAGVGAFFAGPLVARRTTTGVRPPIAHGTRGLPQVAVAAAVTLGLPIALILVAPHLLLPGVHREALDAVLAPLAMPSRGSLSIFALGVLPIVSGFWLAEAIAAVVPRWRQRRLGAAGGRRAIDRLAVGLGLALAAIQAATSARFLQGLDLGGIGLVDRGDGAFFLIVVSLVAGAAVQVVVAGLISRHGLCNGYVALVAAGAARALQRDLADGPRSFAPDHRLALATCVAVIAVAGALAACLRDDSPERRRLPWTGALPVVALSVASGLAVLVLVQLAALVGGGAPDASWLSPLLDPPAWLDVGVAVALAAGAVVLVRGVAGLTASRLGLGITAGFLAALLALRNLAPDLLGIDGWIIPALALTGLVVDGLAAALARLGMAAPVAILAVHDVDRADRAAAALAAAGIPASSENLRLRAMLRGLAGFAPIVIRVARGDADRAIEAIAAAEAARDPAVATFAA